MRSQRGAELAEIAKTQLETIHRQTVYAQIAQLFQLIHHARLAIGKLLEDDHPGPLPGGDPPKHLVEQLKNLPVVSPGRNTQVTLTSGDRQAAEGHPQPQVAGKHAANVFHQPFDRSLTEQRPVELEQGQAGAGDRPATFVIDQQTPKPPLIRHALLDRGDEAGIHEQICLAFAQSVPVLRRHFVDRVVQFVEIFHFLRTASPKSLVRFLTRQHPLVQNGLREAPSTVGSQRYATHLV